MQVALTTNRARAVIVISLAVIASFAPAMAAPQALIVGGDRPVTVQIPAKLTQPAPLLILMHSASSSGERQEKNTKLAAAAKKAGIIFLAPDGTVGLDGRRVWNAAKACCQKPGIEIDDMTYINALIDEIAFELPVDQNRIYMVGHSNGGFMSIAFACATGRIAGVVSLAGAMDRDVRCESDRAFSFLQIHGTQDSTIKFGGGVHNFHPYTAAEETVNRIAAVNQCKESPFTQIALKTKDFDRGISGAETTIHTLAGCKAPTVLWRITGGAHSPKLPTNYGEQIISFLTSTKVGKSQ
jgi:polyhydroxybutyrate depolymerase